MTEEQENRLQKLLNKTRLTLDERDTLRVLLKLRGWGVY